MKKILTKYVVVAIALVTAFSSCSNWLDINTNPYASPTVDPGYIFNYAAVANSGTRQGGDSFIPLAIGSQLIADGGPVAQGGWWAEAWYEFSEYTYGNAWVGIYANVLENLKLSADFAAESGNDNTVAQCEIFMAYMFYQSTMLFGDVPCLQALDPEKYPTPEFDEQKDVLDHCISLLDHAVSIADPAKEGAITNYDIYFEGDMEKWIKVANSMKLQILLTLYNKESEYASDIATLVNAGGFLESNLDDWAFPYFTAAGNQNPCWRLNDAYADDYIEDGGSSYYMFFAHNSVLNPMKQYDDPRMPVYFYKNVDGEYVGLETGDNATYNEGPKEEVYYLCSPVNLKRFFTADMPDVLLSYQEVQFNLAEVYAKGIGVTKDIAAAQTAFTKAVEASCIFWNAEAADVATFKDALPQFSTLADSDILTLINTQRWIDFMSRPFEAFCNQRRTKTPELTTPKLATIFGTKLFNRFQYPSRESGSNPNVPSPLLEFTEPMWFQN